MTNPQLLRDLARLINRYSPEDWEALLRALAKPDLRRQLIYLAGQMRDLSLESRNRLAHPNDVSEIGKKARLLQDLRIQMRSRRIGEVRQLAHRLGLQLTAKSQRSELIDAVIAVLALQDFGEIKRSMAGLLSEGDVPDDYSRWGEVIMGRPSRQKKS